jgi:hypothetical protein
MCAAATEELKTRTARSVLSAAETDPCLVLSRTALPTWATVVNPLKWWAHRQLDVCVTRACGGAALTIPGRCAACCRQFRYHSSEGASSWFIRINAPVPGSY